MNSPLLTKTEVREQLHVSRATLDRLIKAGQISVIRMGNGKRQMVRISPDAVADYLTRSAA